MKIASLNSYLSEVFPPSLQESFDNTGEQILFHEDDIRGIYISLDLDNEVIADALSLGCNLIVSHHPFIFRAVKSVKTDNFKSAQLVELISNRVSVYSMHTNMDRLMATYLSNFLGYGGGEILFPTGEVNGEPTGYGSLVELPQEVKLKDVLENTKGKLSLDFITYAGDLNKEISTIAFFNGSGGSQIEKIIEARRPDCIITGDVGYHNVKSAIDSGVAVIDAGHFGTEIVFKQKIYEIITERLNNLKEEVTVVISDVEKNPFKVYSI